LLDPQFEHVMSIYMLPIASFTRSAWVLPFAVPEVRLALAAVLVRDDVDDVRLITREIGHGRSIAARSICASSFIGRSACPLFGLGGLLVAL
jgi:hypothetical protein